MYGKRKPDKVDGSIDYRKVRLSWCRARLLGFLRKWGVYIVTGIAVLGISGSAPLATMMGVMSISILPLVWALQQPAWICGPVVAGYGAFGAMLLLGMSPLLWSAAWRDIELSLPIPHAAKRRSDLSVISLALLPFYLLCSAGLLKWAATTHATPAALAFTFATLCVAFASSLAAGLVMIEVKRRPAEAKAHAASSHARVRAKNAYRNVGIVEAFFGIPLMRGPARRAMHLLQISPLLLLFPMLLFLRPALAAWWLGLFAPILQILTTRLMSVLQDDLAPLHEDCISLPVKRAQLRTGRRLLALAPSAISLASVAAALFAFVPQLRPPAAIAYVLAAFASNMIEALLGSRARHARSIEPSTRISLWLVMVVLQIALASEITT